MRCTEVGYTAIHSPQQVAVSVFIFNADGSDDSDYSVKQLCIRQQEESSKNGDCISTDNSANNYRVSASDDHDKHQYPDVDWEHKLQPSVAIASHALVKICLNSKVQI